MELFEDPHFYDGEIARLEKRRDKHPALEEAIAFYGSSSIRLWVHMKEDLEPMTLINLGFGGSSFLWCIHHFDRLFQGWQPKEMVLYVGDNDLGRGTAKEEVLKRYHELIDLIRNAYPDIMIRFISIKPSPARDYLIPTIKWVNRHIREHIETTENMAFINIFDAMLDNGHHPNTSYYLSDLLHLNRRGYLVWKKELRAHFDLN